MALRCVQAIYRRRGILYAFFCAVLLTVQDVCVKLALGSSSAYQVTTLRTLILCMCSIPAILISQDGCYLRQETRDHFKLMVTRASCATVGTLLIIIAFSYADIGSVTAIFNSMPVFSGIIGWILLKERFTVVEIALSLCSLTGVFLVAQPPFIFHNKEEADSDNHFVGAIFALVGAIVTAISFVLSRMLSHRKVHPLVSMLYYGTVSTISMFLLTTFLQEWTLPHCGLERMYLILVGVVNAMVRPLLIKSLELEKPVTVTVTLTLNIGLAFVAQFLFLAEKFDLLAAIGASIILVSSVGIALSKSKIDTEMGEGTTELESTRM